MGDHTRLDGDGSESELHIEVSPITPPPLGAGSRTPRSRRRARIWRTIVVASVVLVVLALLVSGFLPVGAPFTGWALSSTPRQIATITPEPTVTLLGKAPTDCPPGNRVAAFSPSFGPGVGVARLHVWFVGFDGPQATLRFTGGTQLTAHGWPAKLLLVAAPDVTQPDHPHRDWHGQQAVVQHEWCGAYNCPAHPRSRVDATLIRRMENMGNVYLHSLGWLLLSQSTVWRAGDRGNILRGWRVAPSLLGNSGTATATSAVAVQHDC